MRFPEPQRTEIDGIPVWYTDVPGPCLAGLEFRVGRCDEALSVSGITHLIEHLALNPLWPARFDHNGRVGLLTTAFYMAGTQEEAERFLLQVCQSLSALPLERLDLERRILRTEAIRRGGSPGGTMSARFGAEAFGVVDWLEVGLGSLTAERVESWTQARFNRSNATLWMTRPPSAELRLPLPSGSRTLPPAPESSPHLTLPAHVHWSAQSVGCSVVGRRSLPLYVGAEVVRARAFEELRLERGLSYASQSWEERLGADRTLMYLNIDLAEGHEEDAIARFVAILEAVAAGELTDADLARACASTLPWSSNDPSRPAHEAARMAVGDLLGHAPTSWEELERQAEDVTVAGVATAFADALSTGLLIVPYGGEPEGRFSPTVEDPPARRMQGRLYVRWDGNTNDEVVAGPLGVSRTIGLGNVKSVRYDECSAVTLAPRGTMWLFGRWGGDFSIELNQLRHGNELARIIREQVGDRFIDLQADAIGWFSMQTILESHDITAIEVMWRELELLADVRAIGERILAVAFADHQKKGILAATDRRLLHLSFAREPNHVVEYPRKDITAVKVSSGLRGARLQITFRGGVRTFDRVRPRALASEFEIVLAPLGQDDEAIERAPEGTPSNGSAS